MSRMSEESAVKTEGKNAAESETKNEDFIEQACSRYLPITGSICTLIFSTNVTCPRILRSIFSSYDALLADSLWLGAHVGTGLYLYTRPHIKKSPTPWRVAYSAAGSVLFNFGTVLFWATAKVVLPKNDVVQTVFGLVTGIAFLEIGRRYLAFVDNSLTS